MAHLAVKDVERWYRTITDIMPLQNEDGSYPYVTDEVEAYEWTSSRSVIGGAWGILAVLGHGIWGVEPVPGQLTVGSGGGGVVTVTGGDYEDVRTHGAVGDGVHDDGPAIQLAIDTAALTGRVVYLPAGVYRISQQLNLHSGTTLEGAGRSSIIRLADGYPANIDMVTTAMGDGTRDVTIRRLCVDGNKDTIGTEGTWTTETGIWTTCLHLLDVTNLVLEDLLIENSTIEGVYLGQVHYGSVTRVEASGNGFWRSDASGIHLDGSSHLVVSDCVTNSNGFHGIIFSAATDNVVTNHYSADNGFDGTRLQWSADRNRFEKFIAERNSRGIYVMHDSTLNHFTHCTLKNSLWNGFFSNNCHGNYLLFTHIENSGEYAVGSVEAGDNQYGFGNTYRNNVLGEYSLAAGSTFTAISGAGGAI
jgi:parallel beta-helix repeat protein